MNEMIPHPNEMRFHEYLDEALSEIERKIFEQHLQDCTVCRKQLAALERLFATIEATPELELGLDLAPAVMAKIAAQKRSPLSLKWTAAVQALLAIALLATGWPVLNAVGGLLDLGSLGANLEVQASAAIQAVLDAWSGVVAAMRGLVPQFGDFPQFELSYLSIVTLLGSATLLWLVGNGLLLRKTSSG